jgi:hypothetical protein
MQKTLKMASAHTHCAKAFSDTSNRPRFRLIGLNRPIEQLDAKPGRKVCEAMRGLVEEA